MLENTAGDVCKFLVCVISNPNRKTNVAITNTQINIGL